MAYILSESHQPYLSLGQTNTQYLCLRLSHEHDCSLYLSLSQGQTSTQYLCLRFSNKQINTVSLSLFLSRCRTRRHNIPSLSHSLSLSLSLSHFQYLSMYPSLSLPKSPSMYNGKTVLSTRGDCPHVRVVANGGQRRLTYMTGHSGDTDVSSGEMAADRLDGAWSRRNLIVHNFFRGTRAVLNRVLNKNYIVVFFN